VGIIVDTVDEGVDAAVENCGEVENILDRSRHLQENNIKEGERAKIFVIKV
jgi:hypothetical protein